MRLMMSIFLLLAGMAGCSPSVPVPIDPTPTGAEPTSSLTAPGETSTPTSCPQPALTASPQEGTLITILALGDSYTIGTSVGESERWPVQLAAALQARGIAAAPPIIVARNGWTTGELEAGIQAAQPEGPFDLVTLLIGVNNQYRGNSRDEYRQEFAILLQQAIAFAGDDAAHVIVLSIPDWGVMPFAEGRDRDQIATDIDAFNAVNREETENAGALYVDVTSISRLAANQLELVASDGLHPSGQMYALWVEKVLEKALPLLEH